jgi:hypothetical protein
VIWSQVGFALIGLVATLADQGAAPRYLFPPQPVLMLCALSAFTGPAVVVSGGRRRKPGSGQLGEAAASVGLALATMFALFPLVQ